MLYVLDWLKRLRAYVVHKTVNGIVNLWETMFDLDILQDYAESSIFSEYPVTLYLAVYMSYDIRNLIQHKLRIILMSKILLEVKS